MIVGMGQVMKLRQYATEVDAVVSAAVSALISGKRADPIDVARAIGISKAALYNKLNGSSTWKASETVGLSRYFAVRLTDLYDGLGGRFGPTENDGVAVGPAGLEPATYGLIVRAFADDHDAQIITLPLERIRRSA